MCNRVLFGCKNSVFYSIVASSEEFSSAVNNWIAVCHKDYPHSFLFDYSSIEKSCFSGAIFYTNNSSPQNCTHYSQPVDKFVDTFPQDRVFLWRLPQKQLLVKCYFSINLPDLLLPKTFIFYSNRIKLAELCKSIFRCFYSLELAAATNNLWLINLLQ